ncbi:anthranilate synthase component I family protein [Lactobacillus sp. LC28-10]|uniref:Anthranilate synthase component 1 n=1 Tax=Secundilactobacillus angelensis TaxID=2722706 RepID=A0ABX1KXI2_9LACO|nr:anthranilate synthase component I family protein [Secundilactobacillus angelensis]MCH5462931.1 anthranilate synthase component I family protein [Secundilactobacillus angelensis]NLR18656.1 anthranilate synthase component I family protein [Secundilactobacillus angelensis]
MTLNELLSAAKDYPAAPVTLEFQLPDFDAVTLFNALKDAQEPGFLLTGKPKKTEDGYTFIGLAPKQTFTYRDGVLTTTVEGGENTTKKTALKPILEGILKQHQTPRIPGLPPFTGGLIGYFSYDYAKYATTALKQQVADPMSLDDADLLLIDRVIAYNHRQQKVTISQIIPTDELKERYDTVISELKKLQQVIINAQPKPLPRFALTQPFHFQFSLSEFSERVAVAQKHIVDGDIFQLIFSNPQQASMSGSLLGVAPTLFKDSPSPYQFYFHHRDFETLGASPETLITKRGNTLFTYPLAGTRRRGATKEEDDKFAHELQTSEKEKSEHNMLIDLGRNDLGVVSQFGSVKVTKTRNLLKFANVMHLGSTVESTADPKASAMDIVNAVLPAGTLSGAPKISAMQIIAKLENRKRGVYGGCLGYLDFSGDLDLCIGIRLTYRKGDQIVVHSGAGIVADSIAKYEYQEFNNKARAVVNAINTADQGGVAHALSN